MQQYICDAAFKFALPEEDVANLADSSVPLITQLHFKKLCSMNGTTFSNDFMCISGIKFFKEFTT